MQKRIFKTNPWRDISKRVPMTSDDVAELKDAVQDQEPAAEENAPFNEKAENSASVTFKKKR